mgnify:CR=1 FL=1
MSEAQPAPAPIPRLGCLSSLGLSLASIVGGGLAACTLVAALAGAWTWVQLGLGGMACAGAAVLAIAGRRRRRLRAAAFVLVLFALLRLLVAAGPGTGPQRPEAPIRCLYAGSGEPGSTWFAGVPERETVLLGALVGLSPPERRRHLDALTAVYQEVAREGLFARDASPLLESWFADRGHCWLAVPEGPGPFPLVVFLHGNGGSFQFYAQLLAREATARGLAIVFPASGLGTYPPGSAEALATRTIEAVAAAAPIARGRMGVVGLSAGAPAAFRAAVAEPGRFRVVASVSGVAPRLGPERLEALRDVRVLILHGGADPRTAVGPIERVEAALRAGGVSVAARIDPDADHLALLERRAEWVPWLLDHLAESLR